MAGKTYIQYSGLPGWSSEAPRKDKKFSDVIQYSIDAKYSWNPARREEGHVTECGGLQISRWVNSNTPELTIACIKQDQFASVVLECEDDERKVTMKIELKDCRLCAINFGNDPNGRTFQHEVWLGQHIFVENPKASKKADYSWAKPQDYASKKWS